MPSTTSKPGGGALPGTRCRVIRQQPNSLQLAEKTGSVQPMRSGGRGTPWAWRRPTAGPRPKRSTACTSRPCRSFRSNRIGLRSRSLRRAAGDCRSPGCKLTHLHAPRLSRSTFPENGTEEESPFASRSAARATALAECEPSSTHTSEHLAVKLRGTALRSASASAMASELTASAPFARSHR